MHFFKHSFDKIIQFVVSNYIHFFCSLYYFVNIHFYICG